MSDIYKREWELANKLMLEKENLELKKSMDQALRIVRQLKGSARYQRCMHELDTLTWILDDRKQEDYKLTLDERGTITDKNGTRYRMEKL